MHSKNCDGGFASKFGFSPKQMMAGMLGGAGMGNPMSIVSELKLSDEQVIKLAELKMRGMSTAIQAKSNMASQMKQFAHELTSENIDEQKIKDIGSKLKEQKNEVGISMIERLIEFAKILTPEQRKQLRVSAARKFLGLHAQEELTA